MEREPEKTKAPVSADSSRQGHHQGVLRERQEHEGVYHRGPGPGKVPPRRRSKPSSERPSGEESATALPA
jgi:hypothetical protein